MKKNVAAFILCSGMGTRLGEFSKDCPKPMLEIGERPIVEYTILNLVKQGIDDIFINTFFMPEKISDYLGDGSKYGARIKYIHEDQLYGTAGSLVNAREDLITFDKILCLYGDVLSNEDFSEILDSHTENSAAITILTHQREKSNSLVLSNKGRVVKFLERPSEEEILNSGVKPPFKINSGIYCLNPKVLFGFEKGCELDFPKDVFPNVIENEMMFEVAKKGFRVAVDSPERLLELRDKIKVQDDFWSATE